VQAVGLQTYIWNNNLRSTLLLAGFPVLLLGMVFFLILGGVWGGVLRPDDGVGAVSYALGVMLAAAPAALVVAAIWFAIAYFFNQVIIDLATGARTVQRSDMPEVYNLLENLCISRGLKTPTVKIIDTEGMNAFASGLHEGRFCITVTSGLLASLDRDELEAVLAHELTHIINRDVRTMVVASVFAGIITLICQVIYRTIAWGGVSVRGGSRRGNIGIFILVALAVAAVGYILAIVIRMAISQTREYVADAGSVELTKNPDAMISALQKVSGNAHLHAPQSVRAMFLEDNEEGILGLFVTHPPLEKRIAALQKYAGGRLLERADPITAPPPVGPDAGDAPKPGPWS